MEEVAEVIEIDGWTLTRTAGISVSGSPRLKSAESLARFAESEKFRAAAMLHEEAQHAVDPRLEALEARRGMQISLRTGRMVSFAATESAAMEIALVSGLSQGQAHRILEQAETLVMDTPEVLESMARGRIGTSHVQRILEHAHHIVPEPLPVPRKEADEATKEQWEREVAQRAAKARADRRDFGVDMLALAPGKCPSQLRARGRQVLEKYYGLSFTKRSRTALRDRRISLEEAGDGMTWLSGYLPTASCQAIFSKIDSMARLLKSDPDAAAEVSRAAREASATGDAAAGIGEPDPDPAETRTMDQLRADTFTDMLLNGPRGQGLETVNAEVFIAIPATMLPGTPGGPTTIDGTPVNGHGAAVNDGVAEANSPDGTGLPAASAPEASVTDTVSTAELPPGNPVPTLLGGGVVDQESAARLMTAAKTWWRLVTDPMTGAIVTFGQARYRPSAAQRAALQFRDGGCTTPGCNGPARSCEVDHTTEWQDGGNTDIANIHLGCKRCHRMKSLGLIEVEQRAGGTTLVTSLFGTKRVSYPAAPWAVADPGTSCTQTAVAPLAPPPADPDALVPRVEEYYLPPRHGPEPETDDEDPGETDILQEWAADQEWTRKLLEEGDPQAADHPGERAMAHTSVDDIPADAAWENAQPQDPAPDPLLDQEISEEKFEAGHYQQLQVREWGQIQDVPDSSSPDPGHGRYAQTGQAKATRKRRLKRNAGEYGPPAVQRPDDRDNPLRPPAEPPPDPPEEPPY